ANRATILHLQVGAEELSFAAMGASPEKSPLHGLIGRARGLLLDVRAAEKLFFRHYRLLRCDARLRALLPRSRPPFALWNDFMVPGSRSGSLNISKRMAPARGATSTSRTDT